MAEILPYMRLTDMRYDDAPRPADAYGHAVYTSIVVELAIGGRTTAYDWVLENVSADKRQASYKGRSDGREGFAWMPAIAPRNNVADAFTFTLCSDEFRRMDNYHDVWLGICKMTVYRLNEYGLSSNRAEIYMQGTPHGIPDVLEHLPVALQRMRKPGFGMRATVGVYLRDAFRKLRPHPLASTDETKLENVPVSYTDENGQVASDLTDVTVFMVNNDREIEVKAAICRNPQLSFKANVKQGDLITTSTTMYYTEEIGCDRVVAVTDRTMKFRIDVIKRIVARLCVIVPDIIYSRGVDGRGCLALLFM